MTKHTQGADDENAERWGRRRMKPVLPARGESPVSPSRGSQGEPPSAKGDGPEAKRTAGVSAVECHQNRTPRWIDAIEQAKEGRQRI